jgi:hypothetical protein
LFEASESVSEAEIFGSPNTNTNGSLGPGESDVQEIFGSPNTNGLLGPGEELFDWLASEFEMVFCILHKDVDAVSSGLSLAAEIIFCILHKDVDAVSSSLASELAAEFVFCILHKDVDAVSSGPSLAAEIVFPIPLLPCGFWLA